MRTLAFVSLLAALSTIGCGSSVPDDAVPAVARMTVETPGKKPLSIPGGAVGRIIYAEGKTFSIRNGRLIVNEKDHGPVQGGDRIKIAEDDSVTVNDQPRKPGASQ